MLGIGSEKCVREGREDAAIGSRRHRRTTSSRDATLVKDKSKDAASWKGVEAGDVRRAHWQVHCYPGSLALLLVFVLNESVRLESGSLDREGFAEAYASIAKGVETQLAVS